MKYQLSYLVKIQFLGFRFHGWQKQPNVKTLHESVDKTLRFVFNHKNFKTLGTGRTDSKVSSKQYPFQLFINEMIDESDFIDSFNSNAPSDIRVLSIRSINDAKFNIINKSKIKEYHYYFSNSGKNHPYAAPFMSGFQNLDLELMKMGAKLYEGTHFFGCYCTKPSPDVTLIRTIDSCHIIENKVLKANFFPKISYILIVKGSGFLRYQIRLMMGALIELGTGKLSLEDIRNSLIKSDQIKIMENIAPGSGLHLHSVEFEI